MQVRNVGHRSAPYTSRCSLCCDRAMSAAASRWLNVSSALSIVGSAQSSVRCRLLPALRCFHASDEAPLLVCRHLQSFSSPGSGASWRRTLPAAAAAASNQPAGLPAVTRHEQRARRADLGRVIIVQCFWTIATRHKQHNFGWHGQLVQRRCGLRVPGHQRGQWRCRCAVRGRSREGRLGGWRRLVQRPLRCDCKCACCTSGCPAASMCIESGSVGARLILLFMQFHHT